MRRAAILAGLMYPQQKEQNWPFNPDLEGKISDDGMSCQPKASRVTSFQGDVARAQGYLEKAREREAVAISEEAEIRNKLAELIAYQNSLPEKEPSQAIAEKISRINVEISDAILKHDEAAALVRQRQLELREAEVKFRIIRADHEAAQSIRSLRRKINLPINLTPSTAPRDVSFLHRRCRNEPLGQCDSCSGFNCLRYIA